MSKEFIVLKMSNYDVAMEVLKGINSSLNFENYDNLLVFDLDISKKDLEGIVYSLESELYTNIIAFKSNGLFYDRKNELIKLISPLLKQKTNGVYNLKELLLSSNVTSKSAILDFILYRTGVDKNYLTEFAKSDLNTSKASKALYMHRNTVLYKADKLYEMTSFDVRSFMDLYILYSLIDN